MCRCRDAVHWTASLSIRLKMGVRSVELLSLSLSWIQTGLQVFKGFGRGVTSSSTMTSEWEQGRAMPACRWDMPEGPDLFLSCSKETLVAMLSLQGVASRTQGIMGNWVWRVIGSGLVRASTSRRVQCAVSHCCLNGILCGGEERVSCIRSQWTTYGHCGWSRDSRSHEKRLLKSLQWRILCVFICVFVCGVFCVWGDGGGSTTVGSVCYIIILTNFRIFFGNPPIKGGLTYK